MVWYGEFFENFCRYDVYIVSQKCGKFGMILYRRCVHRLYMGKMHGKSAQISEICGRKSNLRFQGFNLFYGQPGGFCDIGNGNAKLQ